MSFLLGGVSSLFHRQNNAQDILQQQAAKSGLFQPQTQKATLPPDTPPQTSAPAHSPLETVRTVTMAVSTAVTVGSLGWNAVSSAASTAKAYMAPAATATVETAKAVGSAGKTTLNVAAGAASTAKTIGSWSWWGFRTFLPTKVQVGIGLGCGLTVFILWYTRRGSGGTTINNHPPHFNPPTADGCETEVTYEIRKDGSQITRYKTQCRRPVATAHKANEMGKRQLSPRFAEAVLIAKLHEIRTANAKKLSQDLLGKMDEVLKTVKTNKGKFKSEEEHASLIEQISQIRAESDKALIHNEVKSNRFTLVRENLHAIPVLILPVQLREFTKNHKKELSAELTRRINEALKPFDARKGKFKTEQERKAFIQNAFQLRYEADMELKAKKAADKAAEIVKKLQKTR